MSEEIKKQIDVLRIARKRIELGVNTNLFEAIFIAGRKCFGEKVNIDLLTFDNVKIACKEKKVKMPDLNNRFWFEKTNKVSQMAVCNWMLQKLH
jgi:hypothetical protein